MWDAVVYARDVCESTNAIQMNSSAYHTPVCSRHLPIVVVIPSPHSWDRGHQPSPARPHPQKARDRLNNSYKGAQTGSKGLLTDVIECHWSTKTALFDCRVSPLQRSVVSVEMVIDETLVASSAPAMIVTSANARGLLEGRQSFRD